ncbi:CubicO group peptidase, beta-lactamase class C family [Sphingomonas guangdongensis]|uniref:CubicO group peptidase, beta-lactamase class C family n=1 Tax=Sphingomonas guangdongensis TaxID=1141890 RepID=A0A285R1J4_9SPHN|nr:serine hydrolase domain-containing protein [Sphingomonas guangdongensis]SOB87704.1 CubicO group peptidase, beta-lactamase class C family [Sphingomonas guangdongensis]
MKRLMMAAALAALVPGEAWAQAAPTSVATLAPQVDTIFADWMRAQHVPGLVYGIVKDGRLVLVKGLGTQDQDARAPVTADSRFRIASMSKAFTALAILKLRDAGKLSLEAPAETYVPELKGWAYPTSDSPRVTVRDLLHHTAGFVEDNPWGDRQQPLPEAEFTAMLRRGPVFATTPGTRMEYSNLGYAILGRIVSNVSGTRYQDYISREIMAPLGMRATGYDVLKSPKGARAIGYRWQDEAWVREPDMADGAYGAMGGVETTANDYWRWVSFLLAAWPARDGVDSGPVKRATVREIVEGAGFASASNRSAAAGTPCRQAGSYAMGWRVIDDCDLGRIVTHTGGYPGYGSVVMLLPDAGLGVFAFSSRTYGAPSLPALQSLLAMKAAGAVTDRPIPVSAELARAYEVAKTVWTSGDPARATLAVNVPLDRDLARRRREIVDAKSRVGVCAMNEAVRPISALEGTWEWTCATGRIQGRVQRSPLPDGSLQVIDFRPVG